MDKTFGPRFKKILIMDIAAALLFLMHLLFFWLIASQGQYLQNYAHELLPGYGVEMFRWAALETVGAGIPMAHWHSLKKDGRLRSSDAETYLLIGIINALILTFVLMKALKLFAFLYIAVSHVAIIKTIIVVVTYILPVVIMLAVSVITVLAVIEIHRGRKKLSEKADSI